MSLSVFVPIINDIVFEDSENFFGHLSAVGVLPPNVRLAPIEAIATIDGELNIKFTNYVGIIYEMIIPSPPPPPICIILAENVACL